MDDVEALRNRSRFRRANYWSGLISVMPAASVPCLFTPLLPKEPAIIFLTILFVAWGVSAFTIVRWSERLGGYVDKTVLAQPSAIRLIGLWIAAHIAFFAIAWASGMAMTAIGLVFYRP